MNKNPAHIDNFKTYANVRFAIIDVTFDPVRGSMFFEIASGKTEEEAKERFYGRYMFRETDREMLEIAQRNNRLKMHKIEDNARHLVEDKLFLIA